ncbi:MAG: hypothetical protein RRY36_09610 [Bacteroidaceae bacterium]
MKLSSVNSIAEKLAEYLIKIGASGDLGVKDVYVNNFSPLSDLPESFIEINGNGGLGQLTTERGIMEYNLVLSLHVEQLPSGARNAIRENFLLSRFEGIFNSTLEIGNFHYTLDVKNSVFSGSDLIAGYTSKVLNINVKIY